VTEPAPEEAAPEAQAPEAQESEAQASDAQVPEEQTQAQPDARPDLDATDSAGVGGDASAANDPDAKPGTDPQGGTHG
jgi:hypothetical protein